MSMKEITPALREEIGVRLSEGQSVLRISRETGIGRSRIERIRDSRTETERTIHARTLERVIHTAAETLIDERRDEVADYAARLVRVRQKALDKLETMLEAIEVENPRCWLLLKDIGKVLRDLHEMSESGGERSQSDSADDFYQLLKGPSTINIQHNTYYGKRENKHSDSGD